MSVPNILSFDFWWAVVFWIHWLPKEHDRFATACIRVAGLLHFFWSLLQVTSPPPLQVCEQLLAEFENIKVSLKQRKFEVLRLLFFFHLNSIATSWSSRAEREKQYVVCLFWVITLVWSVIWLLNHFWNCRSYRSYSACVCVCVCGVYVLMHAFEKVDKNRIDEFTHFEVLDWHLYSFCGM